MRRNRGRHTFDPGPKTLSTDKKLVSKPYELTNLLPLAQVLQLLLASTEAEEEVRGVLAECLGHLTLLDPGRTLPALQAAAAGESAAARAAVVTAVKHAVVEAPHAVGRAAAGCAAGVSGGGSRTPTGARPACWSPAVATGTLATRGEHTAYPLQRIPPDRSPRCSQDADHHMPAHRARVNHLLASASVVRDR